jgi:Chalcone isomerase-like
MKKMFLVVVLLLLSTGACAIEVGGVAIEPSVSLDGEVLKLNGSGIRKKFFVKIYIGSLYATRRLASPSEVLNDRGGKLIRMKFVHSKVEHAKITDAFREGLINNAPDVAGTGEARKFLSFFTADFVKGDTVDLALGADGTITVGQNGKTLGTMRSPGLAYGILALYFGPKPADENLLNGMLGKE